MSASSSRIPLPALLDICFSPAIGWSKGTFHYTYLQLDTQTATPTFHFPFLRRFQIHFAENKYDQSSLDRLRQPRRRFIHRHVSISSTLCSFQHQGLLTSVLSGAIQFSHFVLLKLKAYIIENSTNNLQLRSFSSARLTEELRSTVHG